MLGLQLSPQQSFGLKVCYKINNGSDLGFNFSGWVCFSTNNPWAKIYMSPVVPIDLWIGWKVPQPGVGPGLLTNRVSMLNIHYLSGDDHSQDSNMDYEVVVSFKLKKLSTEVSWSKALIIYIRNNKNDNNNNNNSNLFIFQVINYMQPLNNNMYSLC